MPERTAEEIRQEIAVQREGLRDDVAALNGGLRSLVPYLIGGAVGVAVLATALALLIRKIRARG